MKVVIAILTVVCLGLLVVLLSLQNSADKQHKDDLAAAATFSNQVVSANKQVNDLDQVNLTWSNATVTAQQQFTQAAAEVEQLSNNLATVNTTLDDTKTSLVGAQELVTNLNSRIADLEAENKVLDERAASLSNLLAQLTVQIAATKTQLATTRTNAAFLQVELQKQLAQKAELEHKFNDLEELRVQVKKLKDEMWVERRIQMKNSRDGKKGGELLMEHASATPATPAPASVPAAHPPYNLNVEIGSDGSVKILPPPTNTPPTGTNPAPAH